MGGCSPVTDMAPSTDHPDGWRTAMADDPIFAAIRNDDTGAVERLLADHAEVAKSRDGDGLTPVIVARYWSRSAIVERLLAVRADDLDVFEAAAVGRDDLVRTAIAADSGLAAAWSPDGFTALHLAAFFGADGSAETLIAAGAAVNAVSHNDMRVAPLHSAAAGGHAAICRALVANGADVNATQRDSFTPLMAAAESGDDELVDLFLGAGADPAARLDDGRIAADVAADAGHAALAARLAGLSNDG
jgi:ankyrin repeat protein